MGEHAADRPTPYLQVDADVLEANVAEMAALARDRGISLRPHAKTHKCAEIARRQLEAGAVGLTVATVSEAEVFAQSGCTDLFVAYPLWVDSPRGRRLRALADRADVAVGVDSVEGARALAAQVPGTRVLVEVDCGQHRSGTSPDHAGDVAEASIRAGLDVAGVFTFPGHSYHPGAPVDVAAQEARALRTAVASMQRHGVGPGTVSGGSTPSAVASDSHVLSELRPGVYVFGDAQQWELGTAEPDRLALTALGTVVSRAGGRVVLDTGSKVLGADRAPWATGFGRLLDHPDARITSLSEHHAVVEWSPEQPPPGLGDRLRVVPNHACNAVNLADDLVIVRGASTVDTWSVEARGTNT